MMKYLPCGVAIIDFFVVLNFHNFFPTISSFEHDIDFNEKYEYDLLFSSQTDLQDLEKIEEKAIRALKLYIANEGVRISQLQHILENHLQLKSSAVSTGNPIYDFAVVRRLVFEWNRVINVTYETLSNLNRFRSAAEKLLIPSIEDVQGAVSGLKRVQKTYLLESQSLANGCIYDKCWAPELTAEDCYEVGLSYLTEGGWESALEWFEIALQRISQQREIIRRNWSHNPSLANHLMSTRNYDQLEQDIFSKVKISKMMKLGADTLKSSSGLDISDLMAKNYTDMDEFKKAFKQYQMLCRDETPQTQSNYDLHCFYGTGEKNPYFYISPARVEQLNKDPLVLMFHQVIWPSEIKIIKKLVTTQLQTATTSNISNGGSVISDNRVSKSAWIGPRDHPLSAVLNKRIEANTGLSMTTSEYLQVGNYGIGGQYEPHFDFSLPEHNDSFVTPNTGNRIATFMFYMSDVDAGGATVFPYLNISVKPEKGSAIFWYNLFRNGTGDKRTKHGACPVLLGSKWVANMWLHEYDQEFRRPCSLNRFE